MTDRERFAIDQYLMRGGSVIVAAGNYILAPLQLGRAHAAHARERPGGLLAHYGVRLGAGTGDGSAERAVPGAGAAQVGNTTVQEIQAIDYPFFVDVRPTA